MQHDVEKYLVDVLEAAKDISDFSGGISFDEYRNSKLVKAAVERKFEIIGEAMNRISKEAPALLNKSENLERLLRFGI